MEVRCFNCDKAASKEYTLIFESGDVLEDKPMCERCFTFFDDSYPIEVVESPILVRGGDEDDAE